MRFQDLEKNPKGLKVKLSICYLQILNFFNIHSFICIK